MTRRKRHWEKTSFDQLRVGDTVRTVLAHDITTVIAQGIVADFVECKDHTRAVTRYGKLLARSDYSSIYRRV